MITFEWVLKDDPEAKQGLTISEIETEDSLYEGVVTQIDFELIATDELGRTGVMSGAYSPPTDALGEGWIPPEQVTNETLIGWLEACPMLPWWKDEAVAKINTAASVVVVSPPGGSQRITASLPAPAEDLDEAD